MSRHARQVPAYVLLVSLAFMGALAYSVFELHGFGSMVSIEWVVLALFFGIAESVPVHFHHGGQRQSLGAGEALLLPMLLALSLGQVVIGIATLIAVSALFYWRQEPVKSAFNIAQYGLSAFAAGIVWQAFRPTGEVFTFEHFMVLGAAGFSYVLVNQLLVSGAISIAESKPFARTLLASAPSVLTSISGNLTIGIMFAAAYAGASWTVAIFPLPLIALYFGQRALLAQRKERERVEHLHAASVALAGGPDLHHALASFTQEVRELMSAVEARVVVRVDGQYFWTAASEGGISVMEPADKVAARLMQVFENDPEPIVIREEDRSPLSDELGFGSLAAVPLIENDDAIGCLAILGRAGATDIAQSDVRLMDSLANDLMVTLDLHRLFGEVAEERERFRRIFEGSKEGICLLDDFGIVRAWNPALERISGYNARELAGRVWSEKVLVRDDNQRRIEGLDLVRRGVEEQLELVTRDGPTRWISVIAGPVESGKDKGWVLLVRDRTAEHAAEEAKSDFISTISHELRTPLTTIKGSLQVLAREEEVPEEMKAQMVDVMHRGADRLERLVLSLLTVSQMETGELSIIPEEILLDEMVRDSATSVLRDHPDVDIDISHRPIRVRGDREKLGQTVDALLDNARKYGGIHNRIRIELARDGGFARLSVSDRGPGIPKAERQRVFERFVRLGEMNTREAQGAGVGLFIAKRAVEAMGGQIWIDSADGGGATFHVTVPLAHPVAVAHPAQTG